MDPVQRRSQFSGVVAEGTLFNNGDNTFAVYARLVLQRGGTGELHFFGTLNHNTLIPTVGGSLEQQIRHAVSISIDQRQQSPRESFTWRQAFTAPAGRRRGPASHRRSA